MFTSPSSILPSLTIKSRSVVCAVMALAMLGACDRESSDGAQPLPSVDGADAASELTGMLDRTFAGNEIPAITVTDPAGTTLALGETRGKPVLLNLWATWCAPCVVEMPMLDDLAGELGDAVQVLTVSEDLQGAEVVVPFFEQRGFRHLPQWIDANNDLAFAFGGGTVLPLTVLYDADGKEIWRMIGAYEWNSEEARDLVQEAFAN